MKYIGIVVAMEEEKEAIQNLMEDINVKQINDLRFMIGKIQNRDVILVKCGVGKVNAARATQVLIDKFDISCVMNIGVAGAVQVFLDIGDVVIAKHVVQHDFDITAFGHSKGYITGVGDKIICDRDLIDEFEEIIRSIPERNYKIKLGVVATGDIFCTEPWMKEKINGKFNADVVDMECGAIAQVSYLENKPFIAIKTVSDVPNKQNARTFDENLKLASKRCANILSEYLR